LTLSYAGFPTVGTQAPRRPHPRTASKSCRLVRSWRSWVGSQRTAGSAEWTYPKAQRDGGLKGSRAEPKKHRLK